MTVSVLAILDFTKEFTVETDASRVGLGAIMMQEVRLMAFLSKAFSPGNRGKSVYERDLIAIMLMFQKW